MAPTFRGPAVYLLVVVVLPAREVPLGHHLEADTVLTAMDVPMGHLRDTEPVLTGRDVPLGHPMCSASRAVHCDAAAGSGTAVGPSATGVRHTAAGSPDGLSPSGQDVRFVAG